MLSELAIRRPVLASVACLLIIVFGATSIAGLPVRELPDADAAIVTVTTIYTGASPQVVDTDITEVIEAAVAGIAGVRNISSESRRGRGRTVVEFETGRSIEEAANDVRDAVGRVRSSLPTDVREPQVVKSDSNADPVMRLAVVSDRMSAAEITDYVQRRVVDRLATVEGIASIRVYGQRKFAVRVWLDRRAMAARGLTVTDVENALRRNNVELPAGDLESVSRQLAIRLDSRLTSIEQFGRIVIDEVAGYPVRLSDIAKVEGGADNDTTIVRANGQRAVGMALLRQSQSNTMSISTAVRAELAAMRPDLPTGLRIIVGSDDATFIAASIREVLIALSISLVLVVTVILTFLWSLRAIMIPAITIPVSLIGCFVLIQALGFSINVLTLLALLLAIGLVVDDAIVMLENIQRRIDLGESPLLASVRGSREVTFAIIATSITLIAVFIPISFMSGQVGRLFVEFGFVLASAVIISTFVALTACPALASKVLEPRKGAVVPADETAVRGWGARVYVAILNKFMAAPLIVIAVCLAVAGTSYMAFQTLPRELTPSEDRGLIFVPLTAPEGSTITYTDSQARKVEAFAAAMQERGDVRTIYSFTGWGNRPYRSFIVLRLSQWEEREKSHKALQGELIGPVSSLTGAKGFPVTPAGLGLRGSSSPLRIVISGPDFEAVQEWADILLEKARANPGLKDARIDFSQSNPQLTLQVDRARADDLGVGVGTIATTLQTMLASRAVTTFIDRGREYPVLLQARPEDRQVPGDINGIFVRSDDGRNLVPLSALVKGREEAASGTLRRYDRLPSIRLTAALDEGHALGTAIDFMESAARETLPAAARIGLDGHSKQLRDASGGARIVFGLALLIVFLVLAAQFESFVHPLIIMLSVPLAVAGAIHALWWAELSINVYSQIGIILLIGLMAKNGILIVEFANQLRDRGLSVREAVVRASALRLRPIIMTVASTILGALPLVLASGAGAESRIAIGTVIIGGLALSSVLTLFLTPVLYSLLAGLTKPRSAVERVLARELGRIPEAAE